MFWRLRRKKIVGSVKKRGRYEHLSYHYWGTFPCMNLSKGLNSTKTSDMPIIHTHTHTHTNKQINKQTNKQTNTDTIISGRLYKRIFSEINNYRFPAHFRHLFIQFHQLSIQFRPKKLTAFKSKVQFRQIVIHIRFLSIKCNNSAFKFVNCHCR